MSYVTIMYSDNATFQYNTYVTHELIECIIQEIWWDNFVIYLANAEYFEYVYASFIISNTL